MTFCLAELEGREYMWQQYYSQLKQGTGCSQTGLGGWDGDGHGNSVKLGLWYLSAAGNSRDPPYKEGAHVAATVTADKT